MEKQNNTIEQNQEKLNLKSKDVFFVGDSLTVGLTEWTREKWQWYNWIVKWWRMISTMIQEMQKNQNEIKNSKVVVFLGGTNDINSDRTAESILSEIAEAKNIAERNGAKFIVGTIPPIEKVAMWNIETAQERIKKINEEIKKNYNYIDYNSILRDENNENKIAKRYSSGDGIHLNWSGYSAMRNSVQNALNGQNIEISKKEKSPEFEKANQQLNELSVQINDPKKLEEVRNTINQLKENEKMEAQEQLIKIIKDSKWDKIFEQIKNWEKISDEQIKKEIAEILRNKNRENFSNSDLLTLRKKWIDIASLTLINKNIPEKDVNSAEIKEWDSFVVNFGKNNSLAKRTGAGDILPPTVRVVKINGVEAERSNSPRPGYYSIDEKWKKKYQPIYDWYNIEIIKTGQATEEDKKANESRWRSERIRETENNGYKALTSIKEDQEITELAQQNKKSNIEKFANLDLSKLEKWDKWLLDFLAAAEWTNNSNGYNAVFGDGKWTKYNITSMTISEIQALQKTHAQKTGSSAFGRYQFMQETLAEMIKKYDIPLNTKFDENFQDKIALLKLKERWLDDFKSGKISIEEFQLNLAKEWASVAKDNSWLSYYHWDSMNNKATTAWRQVRQVLETIYT